LADTYCALNCHRMTSTATLANNKVVDDKSALTDKMDKTQVELLNEMCIVVDEKDNIVGAKSKKECHLMANIDNGLLHRAFSVMLFNSKGEFLITQRSDAKITFANYLTNTCCSHPLYNELEMDTKDAIGVRRAAQRRLQIELGIEALQIPLGDIKFMTRFLYKAPSGGLWGEHEIDYALVIQKDVSLNPNPNEVKFMKYVSREEFLPFLENEELKGNKVTPWFRLMIDSFLFDWWRNLDNLQQFQDHQNIHRLP